MVGMRRGRTQRNLSLAAVLVRKGMSFEDAARSQGVDVAALKKHMAVEKADDKAREAENIAKGRPANGATPQEVQAIREKVPAGRRTLRPVPPEPPPHPSDDMDPSRAYAKPATDMVQRAQQAAQGSLEVFNTNEAMAPRLAATVVPLTRRSTWWWKAMPGRLEWIQDPSFSTRRLLMTRQQLTFQEKHGYQTTMPAYRVVAWIQREGMREWFGQLVPWEHARIVSPPSAAFGNHTEPQVRAAMEDLLYRWLGPHTPKQPT